MSAAGSALRTWAEMVKLSHSVFALPFALMASFLAGRHIEGRGLPRWGQLGLIVVCMVAARSAAMTFNRIVDAELDARNPRTRGRPLPDGRLSMIAAWAMFGLSAVTFAAGCMGFWILYANAWPMLLSGPVLLVVCGYSLTKRFTKLSHFYLGFSLALAPPAAWLAIHPGSLGLPALALLLSVTGWVAGFDIIYACQDIEVDRRDGLFSIPSRLGPVAALRIARASHALALAGLVALGFLADLGGYYAVGVALAAVLLVIENGLVRPNDYRRVNMAFFLLNGLVSVLLAVATITDLLLSAPTAGV